MAKLEKRREADFTKKEMIELSGCSSAQDFDYKMKNISKYYDIDLNLLNRQTNYYKNKQCGKDCHIAEMELEEMAVSSSIDKWMEVCSLMAELGFGRCVIEVFKKN